MKTQASSTAPGLNLTPNSTNDSLLTVAEAAKFLNLSPGGLYHLISQRRVPVVRISSRCVRFKLSALREWVESLSHPAEDGK